MCQQVYCKAAISILIPFKHLYSRFVFLFFTCEKKIERNAVSYLGLGYLCQTKGEYYLMNACFRLLSLIVFIT